MDEQADKSGEGLAQKLIGEIGQLRQELSKAQDAIRKVESRRGVERAVGEAQARDVQAAADAVEQRLNAGAADVGQALREIRRERPGLFGGAEVKASEHVNIEQLRERARGGDRASLLLYLRVRREKA